MLQNQIQTGLNWEVNTSKLYANGQQVKGYKVLTNSQTGTVLNVCRDTYTPTPNSQFADMVHELSYRTGFNLEMLETLQDGRKVIAYLQMPEGYKVSIAGYDFKDNLLIGNSHDSSTGLFLGASSLMVRCANRFTSHFQGLRLRHTSNHISYIPQLVGAFDHANQLRGKRNLQLEAMQRIKISGSDISNLVELLIPPSRAEKESTRRKNLVEKLSESIEFETKELGQNAFGLFNGVTHYTTHRMSDPMGSYRDAFGGRQLIAAKAYNFCTQL